MDSPRILFILYQMTNLPNPETTFILIQCHFHLISTTNAITLMSTAHATLIYFSDRRFTDLSLQASSMNLQDLESISFQSSSDPMPNVFPK